MKTLVPYIWAAGAIQLVIASANFFLPKKLHYAENLRRVETIIRQVFVIHSVYIVGNLVFFAALCFLFGAELAGASALGRFLSGFLALFWLARVGVQTLYYDPEVKRQNYVFHVGFTLAFLYLGVVFLVSALGVVS